MVLSQLKNLFGEKAEPAKHKGVRIRLIDEKPNVRIRLLSHQEPNPSPRDKILSYNTLISIDEICDTMYKELKDAYDVVKHYESHGNLDTLKGEWLANPMLRVTTSDKLVKISTEALEQYLTKIHKKTLRTGKEMGFGYVMNKDGTYIYLIASLIEGDYGSVDIGSEKASKKLKKLEMKIKEEQTKHHKLFHDNSSGYGHTHPIGYGPIFSHVDTCSLPINPFGNDYMFASQTLGRYHSVGSPHQNLLGVIETLPYGEIKYRKWLPYVPQK